MADTRSPDVTGTRPRAWAVAVAVAALALAGCGDDGQDVIDIDGAIDGTPLAEADGSAPIPISDDESQLDLVLTNTSGSSQDIRYLRLEGEVVGLTFLTYTTSLRITLGPDEVRSLTVPLDFFDVESQAHGYLRTDLAVYGGADRERLGSTEFAADVRGSVVSTMALFAVLLVAATALSLLVNLQGLARRTLPTNRFRRGVQFGLSGLGIGLVLTVAFSVLRVFPLSAAAWWPLIAIPTAVAFAIGYLAPGADEPPEVDDDLRELDELLGDVAET